MSKVNVIIPWCDRPELCKALVHSKANYSQTEVSVTIVNCGGSSQTLGRLAAEADIPNVVISECTGPFNKSRAINFGVSRSSSSILLLIDADVYLTPNGFADILHGVGDGRFAVLGEVIETEPLVRPSAALSSRSTTFELLMLSGQRISLPSSRTNYRTNSRRGTGIIAVTRNDFLKCGGMNSQLVGWGWEDCDLALRLMASGATMCDAGSGFHISHGDHARSLHGRSRAECEDQNFHRALIRYESGNFLGTFESDT